MAEKPAAPLPAQPKPVDLTKMFGTLAGHENESYILGLDPGARNLGVALINVDTKKVDYCANIPIVSKAQLGDVLKKPNGDNDASHRSLICAMKQTMYSNEWAHIFSNPRQIVWVAVEDQFISTSVIQALTHCLIFHFSPRCVVYNVTKVKGHFDCIRDDDDKTKVQEAAIPHMSEKCFTEFQKIPRTQKQHPADAILYGLWCLENIEKQLSVSKNVLCL